MRGITHKRSKHGFAWVTTLSPEDAAQHQADSRAEVIEALGLESNDPRSSTALWVLYDIANPPVFDPPEDP